MTHFHSILAAVLAILASTLVASADSLEDKCLAAEISTWTDLEKASWRHICLGEPAIINQMAQIDVCPSELDDRSARHNYPKKLSVSGDFVERVLQDDFLSLTPQGAVTIVCARLDGNVNLNSYRLSRPIRLPRSFFSSSLLLRDADAAFDFDIRESYIKGNLAADGFETDRGFRARGLIVEGGADFDGARVSGSLDLRGAMIDGELSIEAATINGNLELNHRGAFDDIRLVGTQVDNFLQLRGSTFSGDVDLTGVQVNGELHLASVTSDGRDLPSWGDDSRLILRNAQVQALQDLHDAWPSCSDLVGFEYDAPGGLRGSLEDTLGSRNVSDLLGWLRTQDGYGTAHSPQPYEQLASVLKNVGRPSDANWIRFMSRTDEMHSEEVRLGRRIWLGLTGALIGYGIYPAFSGIWLIVLTLACWIYYVRESDFRDPVRDRMTRTQSFWFAIDASIPVVAVGGKRHEEIFDALKDRTRHFVYLHRLLAFVLFTFFAAGITGLID